MSALREFSTQASMGIDREHQGQLDLLKRLCLAVDVGDGAHVVRPLIAELIDFTEAHFMSEELLMRMKSHDDYEVHLADHVRMLQALNDLAAPDGVSWPALSTGKAHELLIFVTQHIATRDKRLAEDMSIAQQVAVDA